MTILKFPLMPKQCKSCPFRKDNNGRYLDERLATRLQIQCTTEANHLCHQPQIDGKEPTHFCRGARNYQLEVFYRLGVLSAPTDEAWEQALEKFAK